MKTRSRAVVSMLPLTCTGWIAVDSKSTVPYECTREHPELPRGFPMVWKNARAVLKPYSAQQVQVSLKAIYPKRKSAIPPQADQQKELAGTVNKETPNSEKEKGGAK